MTQLPVIQPAAQGPASAASQPGPAETAAIAPDRDRTEALKPAIVDAIRKVFDPEIPVNIYDLGLIYDIFADAAGIVGIRMTLTAPACPAAQFLPSEVKRRIAEIPGVSDVKVDVVWDPPWDRDRMSDAAKLQLGMF
jgi:FeS assembly SUF system protein